MGRTCKAAEAFSAINHGDQTANRALQIAIAALIGPFYDFRRNGGQAASNLSEVLKAVSSIIQSIGLSDGRTASGGCGVRDGGGPLSVDSGAAL
jgi:hypothetical protein